ncbi:mitotic checkpoint regulator, MAD2B-interacting-domain-containing protein [Flagelloscypha sp. PMI_526]|nr:mitotic checkpoint regulator, MAD2B-interacting-domain-containing protein [Flagelloscypha sp. PMI_526]
MVLGLDAYGSGSESESESPSQSIPQPKKRAPKRIAVTLPSVEPSNAVEPPRKRQKIEGAGKNSKHWTLSKEKNRMMTHPNQSQFLSSQHPSDKQLQTVYQPVPAPEPVDFFGLNESSTSTAAQVATGATSKLSLSSAPDIPEFAPPEPSRDDEYPGYYKLPSGKWAAHDPEVYARFLKEWQRDYNKHLKALEKGVDRGFEGAEAEDTAHINAMEETAKMQALHRDREERKKLTQGDNEEPAQPRMTITASKMSGIARTRHQLGTMLMQAYENREQLEEQIAQGRRNRKEAGSRYGMFVHFKTS